MLVNEAFISHITEFVNGYKTNNLRDFNVVISFDNRLRRSRGSWFGLCVRKRHDVLTPLAVLLLGTVPFPGLTAWWRGVSSTREYSLTSVLASRWCCSPGRSGRRCSPSPSASVSGSGWPRVSGNNGMQMMQSSVQHVRMTWWRKKPFWLWSSMSGAVNMPKPALARTKPTPPPL